jgi:glycosyltransferase involved in cell wall biosynthesis
MKLSILIPTLPEPESQNYLKRLLSILNPQIENRTDVEILTHDGPRSMPTGTKRNELIARAQGEYFSQIDCDDVVPIYYVSELLKATEQTPDVITFKGFMTTNGSDRRGFTIRKDSEYTEKEGHYYRFANHLCCFKKSLIGHIKFQPIWIQEDYQWALSVKRSGLLKTEVHIENWMYHYDYKTKLSPMQQRMRR